MKTVLQQELQVQEQELQRVLLPETPPKKSNKTWQMVIALCLCFSFFSFGLLTGFLFARERYRAVPEEKKEQEEKIDYGVPEWVIPAVIEVDGASRRGEKLEAVRDIAVHYVANPGSTAEANRNYFNGPDSTSSAHFIIGLKGEVLLCVPLDEKSSATNHRNLDTISIEVCHPDETGEFSFETRDSLVKLLTFLCEKYDLSTEHIIRHYDVTGKMCPLYYVENPQAWDELKQDVKDSLMMS